MSVRELRNHSAQWIRRAAAGEQLVITVDGRPTAVLGPLTTTEPDRLEYLIAKGLLVAATQPPTSEPAVELLPTWTGTRLDQTLKEVRGR